jgi:hypothetical protein
VFMQGADTTEFIIRMGKDRQNIHES